MGVCKFVGFWVWGAIAEVRRSPKASLDFAEPALLGLYMVFVFMVLF